MQTIYDLFTTGDVATWGQGLSLELYWLGLFVSAFVAGSVFAFPSELVLVAGSALDAPPLGSVLVATAGNTLGAISVYALGRVMRSGSHGRVSSRLSSWAQRRGDSLHASLERFGERLERGVERHGARMMLLAWLPVVGDVLAFGAGAMGLRVGPVLVYTTLGKFARYAFVAYLASCHVSPQM